jgi:uncharacterized membrane protein YjfL (UPF0719 family)
MMWGGIAVVVLLIMYMIYTYYSKKIVCTAQNAETVCTRPLQSTCVDGSCGSFKWYRKGDTGSK